MPLVGYIRRDRVHVARGGKRINGTHMNESSNFLFILNGDGSLDDI